MRILADCTIPAIAAKDFAVQATLTGKSPSHGNESATPCERTAQRARLACFVDATEELHLICTGDSLDILATDACGIDDPGELFEVICGIAGEWFCD